MRKARRLVAWLAGATVFALIAQFGFFFYRDNFSTSYPLKVLSAASYRAGEIPYWNFNDSGGQPLAGNPGPETFYPDNVLYLLLPAHVAFNLHFLLHLAAAFFAMRALCLARSVSRSAANFAATTYLLSGVVVSSTANYHSVVVVALIPFALYAVERRSWRRLGIACGLMGLAAEPVLTLAAGIAIAVAAAGRMRPRDLAAALLVALAIASPQLIALTDIASEVERTAGYSTRTALNTSLTWTRVAEIFVWPLLGVLNDPGGGVLRERLFSTIFLGVIAVPALGRRSRYTLLAALMLFLALGRHNPIVLWAVEHGPRLIRYPEKFALVLVIALVVLIAHFFDETRHRAIWAAVTLVPLLITAYRALPIDRFAPYDIHGAAPPQRVQMKSSIPAGTMPARVEYRKRAVAREPLFGAVIGMRYALVPSPDSMHSLLSRAALERFNAGSPERKARYLAIQQLPPVMAVPVAIGARSLREAVAIVEDPRFDPRVIAVAPSRLHGFRSARASHLSYREHGQTISVAIEADGPILLLVNQSYFSAWIARADDARLQILPLDVDRLGVLVPAGTKLVTLRFGRNRLAVAAAWCASSLLMIAMLAIEKRDRRAREVQRTGDDDSTLG
jgi:hypothetical protein